jgi:flagellar protein FliL
MAEKDADLEKAPAEEGGAPKGKKKLMFIIIIAVAAVALLAVGFFVVPKLMGGGEKKADVKAEEGVMFTLEPFVVNLNDPGGPNKFLKVSLQLELANIQLMDKAKAKAPQIRDAVITLLTSKSSESLFPPEGKLQLKDEINARMNQILGAGSVKNVYLTDFVMQ